MAKSMLVADYVSFAYPESSRVWVWNLEFRGGFTWIMGENGSGKSTLMKVLAGGLVPSAGALSWRQLDSKRDFLQYRRSVFWCGPGSTPFAHLTAYEFLGFMRGLYPTFDARLLESHIVGFGVRGFMKERLSSLSTGTQRKVWLMGALLSQTPVVLLDEPMSGLDSSSRDYLEQALCAQSQLAIERTWIFTGHEPLGEVSARSTNLDIEPFAKHGAIPLSNRSSVISALV